jgi:hypothetical protein
MLPAAAGLALTIDPGEVAKETFPTYLFAEIGKAL